MKKLLVIISLIFTISTSLFSQEKNTFSIDEAEEFSVENSQKIKNAQLDIESAEKKVWETIAIGLPQVSAEANFQHFIDIPTSVVDADLFNPMAPPGSIMEFRMGQKFNASGAINVNQLIFDGSYIVGLQFSKFYQKMIQTNTEKTIIDAKAMVREAYYNVLVAQKNLSLMDSIVGITEKLYIQTKAFFDNGFILKDELDQIEIAYNRVKVTRSNAQNQVFIAKNLLKLQMGYSLDQEINLSQNFDEVLASISQNNPALQEFNVSSNYNYVLLEQQKQLDEYALKNEKAKYLPSVGAYFTHSQNAFRNDFDFFDGGGAWYPTTIWGIGVQVPIASSGQKMMKVQQAEIKIKQDINNLEDAERGLKFQELQLKAYFINAFEMMQLEEQNVKLAENIYKNTSFKKNEGFVSAFQVTQVQNQLLQAQGNYIAAVMQVFQYKIELDKLFNI